MKKILLILSLFFIFNYVSAAGLSLSPTQLNFHGKTNEKLCVPLNIEVNGSADLTGKILWAEKGYSERKLSMHHIESKEIGIEASIPNLISVTGNKEIQVCIKVKKEGTYHGAVLYKFEDKPIQVGVWVNATIEKGIGILRMNGNSVKKKSFNPNNLIILPTILIIFLSLLVLIQRRLKTRIE